MLHFNQINNTKMLNLLNNPKNKTIAVGLIVLIILTVLNVYISQKTPTLQPETSAQRQGQAVLSLDPTTSKVKPTQTFSVSINIDPQGETIDAVDAILIFDSQKLTVQSLTPDTLFPSYPVQKIDNDNGKVQLSAFSVGSEPIPKPVSKAGVLGTVTFQTLSAGTTQITLSSDSIVASQGENVLGSTVNSTINVQP